MIKSNYINTCAVFENGFSCFDELTPKQQEIIKSNQVDLTYKRGEIVCKQGSLATHVMFLRKGLVKVYLEGKNKTLILKIIPSNNIIGLPSIIEGSNTFSYSVATYTDSEICQIDINVFKQMLKRNAAFANKIINILNENTQQIYGRFFCLTSKQMHGKLADILLCLSQRVFKKKSFDLDLTRNELAELAAMSTESVIRIMKEFKRDGLIKEDGKNFEITDFEGLTKISQLC